MQRKLGGGGSFAYAYVIAHEVGHHVQNLIGLLPQVQQAEARADRAQANAISVRTDLMADCVAGVWAYDVNERHHNIDDADVQQAISTASTIGHDRRQQHAGRPVVMLDSFTHASSAQRVHRLAVGLLGGDVRTGNTLNQSSQ
jgi:hypothetical protein